MANPSSARLALVFSCLGHAYMHLFAAFYFVIVLALEEAWALPYHQLIELWTLGALLVGVAALPAGWLGDRWSAPGMMVVFFLGLGAAGIACALADGPTAMLLGLSAIGLFAAIYHPVGIAWLVRNAAPETKGKTLGVNGVFGLVGVAASGLVAGALIDLISWRAAFAVPGAVSLATGLVLLACLATGRIRDAGQDRAPEPAPDRRDSLRVWIVLLATMFLMGLIFQATQAALPKAFDLRLGERVGEGAFGVGALVAGVYAVGGLMQVLGGHLADRWPLKRVYLGAFALQVPVLLAVALAGGPALVAVAVAAVVLASGALPAENMMLARHTPAHRRSLAFGLKFVLAFGAAPVAMQLVARVQEATGAFVWLFVILAGFACLSALAAAQLPGAPRRPEAVPEPAE